MSRSVEVGAVWHLLTCTALLLAGGAAPVTAQHLSNTALEFAAGYAGFVDESMIDHAVAGVGLRVPLSPRVAVGPEVVYMRGPGGDRDLFMTGNITVNVVSRQGRGVVSPFLVAGGGVFRHTDRVGIGTFSSWEGAITGGGGVRAWVSDRVYVAGDARLGWELHYRVAGLVGVTLER